MCLYSLINLPEGMIFNNGCGVYLYPETIKTESIVDFNLYFDRMKKFILTK